MLRGKELLPQQSKDLRGRFETAEVLAAAFCVPPPRYRCMIAAVLHRNRQVGLVLDVLRVCDHTTRFATRGVTRGGGGEGA